MRTAIVRVSTSLITSALRQGNAINVVVTLGLPGDAQLLDAWMSEDASEMFLVFSTESDDPRFTGAETDDAPWMEIQLTDVTTRDLTDEELQPLAFWDRILWTYWIDWQRPWETKTAFRNRVSDAMIRDHPERVEYLIEARDKNKRSY